MRCSFLLGHRTQSRAQPGPAAPAMGYEFAGKSECPIGPSVRRSAPSAIHCPSMARPFPCCQEARVWRAVRRRRRSNATPSASSRVRTRREELCSGIVQPQLVESPAVAGPPSVHRRQCRLRTADPVKGASTRSACEIANIDFDDALVSRRMATTLARSSRLTHSIDYQQFPFNFAVAVEGVSSLLHSRREKEDYQ